MSIARRNEYWIQGSFRAQNEPGQIPHATFQSVLDDSVPDGGGTVETDVTGTDYMVDVKANLASALLLTDDEMTSLENALSTSYFLGSMGDNDILELSYRDTSEASSSCTHPHQRRLVNTVNNYRLRLRKTTPVHSQAHDIFVEFQSSTVLDSYLQSAGLSTSDMCVDGTTMAFESETFFVSGTNLTNSFHGVMSNFYEDGSALDGFTEAVVNELGYSDEAPFVFTTTLKSSLSPDTSYNSGAFLFRDTSASIVVSVFICITAFVFIVFVCMKGIDQFFSRRISSR
jgi:hypothetical protein